MRDENLFEKCEFDLLTRKALGMELLTDVTPSIDTYYLFRRRICEYQERTAIDLMQICSSSLPAIRYVFSKYQASASVWTVSLSAVISLASLVMNRYIQFWSSSSRHARFPISLQSRKSEQKEYLKEDSSKTVYRSDSDTLQRKFALFESIREAFGFFKAISRKIFTSGADCYVSLNITILVMLDSKCAPFSNVLSY